MNTYISSIYLNLITDLAKNFAKNRSYEFDDQYRSKVYNSTFDVYYNISIFLYIRLNKITKSKIKFNYNRVPSILLKKFSCKLYRKILLDLEYNKIIKINNHYSNNKKYNFSKSYLIHRDLIHKINESKRKFKYDLVNIQIPDKIIKITKWSSTNSYDDSFSFRQKLNTYYRTNQSEDKFNTINFYKELNYKETDLDDYCKDDEFLYNFFKKQLFRLNNEPKLIKNRFYHVFHEFPKEFREKVLRFNGRKIYEIFDVSGSDLHMLAKYLENEDIPIDELLKFQKEVKNDLRKKFGIRKKDGKCNYYVKKAFKVYLNLKEDRYGYFRYNSYCRKIDEYFKENFPSIREFIIKHDNIWEISMNNEFDVISDRIVKFLYKKGIKALTCHDSIYVNTGIKIPNIKEIFYDQLDLLTDRIDRMENL